MENQENIDQHKKILGILFIVFSLLNVVLVLFFVMMASSILPNFVNDQGVLFAANIAKYALITLILMLTTPAFIAGVGLLYKKEWALTLALVIGIIGILGFPFWTFIGIYTIIIFIMSQSNSRPKQAKEFLMD